jgi:hypothetical protein
MILCCVSLTEAIINIITNAALTLKYLVLPCDWKRRPNKRSHHCSTGFIELGYMKKEGMKFL